MMRTKLTLVAASLAALMMTTAHAAPPPAEADLSISAKVVPSACNFNIGDGGTWDYGERAFASLDPAGYTNVSGGYIPKPASLQCNAPTLIKIKTADNRQGTDSAGFPTSYGLGLDAAGNRIGVTYFSAINVYMDGTPAYSVFKKDNDNGGVWSMMSSPGNPVPTTNIEHGEFYFSFSTSTSAPSPVTNVTWDMINSTDIVPSAWLDGTREITLDGFATMELIYI